MKFRTQMLLAFVPIFLLLGASGETVLALLEHREMRWGLEEEASSLAVSISEFLQDAPFVAPPPTAAGALTWEQSLATVMQRHQVLRLDLFAADGRTVLRHLGADRDGDAAPRVPAPVMARLGQEPWVLGEIVGRDRGATLAAFAPLRPAGGAVAGYLELEVSAADYVEASALAAKRIGAGALASLLAGLVVIGLVVAPVTRSTQELRAAADRAQAGEELTPPDARHIQETGDLGETFGTMSTLLTEAMDKTRRTLVENEQLRTSQDLAAAFHAQFSQPVQLRQGTVDVTARIVGRDPGGAFFGSRLLDSTLWIFTGQVEVADKLQQAVTASAARQYLDDALARLAPEAAVTEVASVLPLTNWTCLAWPLDGGAPRRWAGKGRRTTSPSAPVDIARPVCLHTFGPEWQPKVDTCLSAFDGLPTGEIAENICRLLGGQARGAIAILRFAPAGTGPNSPAPP